MDLEVPVMCMENEPLAVFMWSKKLELANNPKGISENIRKVFSKAYSNICNYETPIRSLKDLSQINGVGKWLLRLMRGYFERDSGICYEDKENQKLATNEKMGDKSKRYLPQKNSAAYALLITLYRGIKNGNEFMLKKDLVDSTEASGLSRVPFTQNVIHGRHQNFGNSSRDLYSGWSCMKTLLRRGLVAKSSCPAKYMLTQEGHDAAQECLARSGFTENLFTNEEKHRTTVAEATSLNLEKVTSSCSKRHKKSINITCPSIAILNNSKTSNSVCADKRYMPEAVCSSKPEGFSFNLKACSSSGFVLQNTKFLLPPLLSGENFKDVYEVILILDNREQFALQRSKSHKIIENSRKEFNIKIELRRLLVGDGIWIARHKSTFKEYVLDFIVERKNVDDLHSSIRDNRYKEQKLRLLRCGLKKLIYLVEGNPNFSESSESIKTACFTTEILEGFDVHRTKNLHETLKKYCYLTREITQYYGKRCDGHCVTNGICPMFEEFIKRCEDQEKMTVTDVFALQLMQVPQVTEEIALIVVELYPTLFSLAHAYSLLDGDSKGQEELLRKVSNNTVSLIASKNIFHLVWKD